MLSAEDLALLSGDTPDLPPGSSNSITLLQPNSPQLAVSSNNYVEGAAVGDFVSFVQGRAIVIDGSTGITFVPVGFELSWPEFLPNRGGHTGRTYTEKPAGAVWKKAFELPDAKAGLFLGDNRVEQTITVAMLVFPNPADHEGVEPYGATFAFRSSSLATGRDFANRASRVRVTVDGVELTGPTIGLWRLSSRSEAKGAHRWQAPFVIPVGKLGEARGPTIEQVRQAAKLRADFKRGLMRVAHQASQAAIGVREMDDDDPETESGGSFGNDNGPPAPPPSDYDGPDNDDDGDDFPNF